MRVAVIVANPCMGPTLTVTTDDLTPAHLDQPHVRNSRYSEGRQFRQLFVFIGPMTTDQGAFTMTRELRGATAVAIGLGIALAATGYPRMDRQALVRRGL